MALPRPGGARLKLWWLMAAIGLCVTLPAKSGEIILDDVHIYYSAFPSRLIPPGVAAAHDLTRAEDLMMINISIKKGDQPIEADISGDVTNILGQARAIRFVPIVEQDALYYLGEVIVDEKDWLRFYLTIDSDSMSEPYELQFERRFY